jgi:hypothetical protein
MAPAEKQPQAHLEQQVKDDGRAPGTDQAADGPEPAGTKSRPPKDVPPDIGGRAAAARGCRSAVVRIICGHVPATLKMGA